MTKYTVTWKLEIEADDPSEAAHLHLACLKAMDDAPCAVYVRGDGPERVEPKVAPR
jgi:hypothetical protein